MPSKIGDEHLEHYRRHGYAVIENWLSADELTQAYAEIEVHLPGILAYGADPAATPVPDPLPPGLIVFPFKTPFLNRLGTAPELRDFAERIVGHADLICEHTNLITKLATEPQTEEQDMHVDMGGHTLTYATSDPRFWQVQFILYYTDVGPNQSPTAVVSNEVVGDVLRWPSIYSRDERPEWYEQERKVTVPAGSLFAYSLRTFHRGTKFNSPGSRITHFTTYMPANCPWLGILGWAGRASGEDWTNFVEQATPDERTMFGFPPPGHEFWTQDALRGTQARYPNMDMSPYDAT